MKRVILRWLFRSSPHSLDIVVGESEAKEYLRQWRELSGTNLVLNGYDYEQDRMWQVDLNEVAGALTINIEKAKEEHEMQKKIAQQQQGTGITNRPKGWGLS